jgi:hypothetical protein
MTEADEFWAESGPVTGAGLSWPGVPKGQPGRPSRIWVVAAWGLVVEVAGHADRPLLAVAVEECGDVGADADCLFV